MMAPAADRDTTFLRENEYMQRIADELDEQEKRMLAGESMVDGNGQPIVHPLSIPALAAQFTGSLLAAEIHKPNLDLRTLAQTAICCAAELRKQLDELKTR
jgi:hypothetical protein